GIQTGLLRNGLTSWLKADQRVVIVHALNPYGFAHLRRADEDNVDLNRNFVDHSKPYSENSNYDALANAIAPSSPLTKSALDRSGLIRFFGVVI
ncbi:MAG: DUF2817 domain-containing protein, partial [bacterium]|nr:DUF2817 domain-containing protein [bacterium]